MNGVEELSKITYQDIVTTLAIVISLVSLWYSRKAINVSSKTALSPKEMYFNQKGNGQFVVKLYNSGPGLAYDVKISAFHKIDYENHRSGTWVKHAVAVGRGITEIQANEMVEFIFEDIDVFGLHYRRPIKISYKLSNGKKLVSYWTYLMGESSHTNFIKMTKLENLFYHYIKKSYFDRLSDTQKTPGVNQSRR